MDIITTLFRVVRNFPDLAEFLKLEFIRVRAPGPPWQLRSSSALGVCAAPATAAPHAAPKGHSRLKSACGRMGVRRVFALRLNFCYLGLTCLHAMSLALGSLCTPSQVFGKSLDDGRA